ncbi:MAG: MMPL family transporter, partial [Kineosporiaceae bacterium]
PQVAPGLRSTDGRRALVVVHLDGDEDAVVKRADALEEEYTTRAGGITVQTGGLGQASVDINRQVTSDLARAEMIAIPLTLILLVVVFGSLVSGMLPLLVGGMAIAATFAVLSLLAEVTSVSIFALNLTTALGLGLGIDYSLLIVSRFREELAAGRAVPDAVAVTLATAGRTVAFSAATIAVALAALLVFPLYFLRSFAYAGMAVVVVAAIASVVTLPALLAVLGRRVDAVRIGRRRSREITAGGAGFWNGLARFVMRRPVVAAAPVIAVLLGLGTPFLGVSFAVPDDRSVPAEVSQGRQVGDVLRTEFRGQDASAIVAVLPGATPAAMAGYAERVSAVPGVARVVSSSGVVRAVLAVDPFGAQAEQAVHDVRAVAVPGSGEVLVGGPSASLVDTKAAIGGRLPLAAVLIGLTTFILLFLFTGSVVLPLKALVVNAFTIVAVLGSMVWVFQDGHLSGLLGFTPLPLTITMPLLMFCVAFGLSMDYEVFLLGRIKELHDAGMDTTTAVATGLARTGRIITTAAALLSITMFAFVSSRVSFIQMFGLGTGLAIVLDATLVRGVLVPALMRVMGRFNWWAPAPLRRVHRRIGLRESGGLTGSRPAELVGG